MPKSLPREALKIKSIEGLKVRLGMSVGDPSIRSYNAELVIFRQDFERCHQPSHSRRVFDLAVSWFVLSEAWSTCSIPLTGMPRGVWRKEWPFSSTPTTSWGRTRRIVLVPNWAFLRTASFPKTFAIIFAQQTGIKYLKFTSDARGAENTSRKCWLKS